MIRISDIKLPINYTKKDIILACEKKIKLKSYNIKDITLVKKGIDARKKNDIRYSLTVDVEVNADEDIVISKCRSQNITKASTKNYELPGKYCKAMRPVVIGSGPAGLFSAYILAMCGAKPIVLERGYDVEKRRLAIDNFRLNAIIDETSNIQFGEGGAGTFSDGKLNTGIKDTRIRKVLQIFCEHGTPEEILFSAKPHIGTDKLAPTVKNIRNKIISLGGEFLFESKLTAINTIDDKVKSITYEKNGNEITLECEDLILAIGHSARDTFEMLEKMGVPLASKPFSIGARVEHLQKDIDIAQYGTDNYKDILGAADYKLSAHLKNGRGVYTFCMCPGGYVVPAASEKNTVVTNGMSEFARDNDNANSALLVGVNPEDFGYDSPLAGMYFQRKIEQDAFILGGRNYHAPATLIGDFMKNRASSSLGKVKPSYLPGVKLTNIADCLPDFVADSMREAIQILQNRLKGFDCPDAVLTAPETRSSSPVRILRDESMQSLKIKGLYPCGEGAGYAGGITSAAVDGIKCAEAVINRK
ncbi:MAG: NAD(P)/FAD-dependent oxidoreductase [Clostridia bacterium]|nr:NAD(P)/FAD-dependent oxidoreductase [Clostridia bacterium]